MKKWKLLKLTFILLAIVVLFYCMFRMATSIEQDLYKKTVNTLKKHNVSSVYPSLNGRDVVLHGVVGSLQEKEEIERIVRGVKGVRTVFNRLSVRKIFLGDTNKYVESAKSEHEKTDRLADTEALKELLTSYRINFPPNSYRLIEKEKRKLEDMAQQLRKYLNITIEISGYADSSGSDSLNLILSQKRANAVYEFLTQQHLPGIRFFAEGCGSQNPLKSNNNPEGRAVNRRVEFKLKESK